jgi:excisionase family DNA binding protein
MAEEKINNEESNPYMDLLNAILERLLIVEQEIKEHTPKDQFTSTEAARYLNIKMNWLNKLCSQGKLRYGQPGGKIRVFKKTELDKYLQKNPRLSDDDIDQISDKFFNKI